MSGIRIRRWSAGLEGGLTVSSVLALSVTAFVANAAETAAGSPGKETVSLDAVTPEFVAACLRIAREQYDYVLVDIAPSWTNWSYAALSRSDMIVLVTQLTVAGIRQSLRQIQTIEANGLTQIPLKIVLNRHDTGWRLGTSAHVKDAEITLGRKFDFVLPNDFKLVSEAINQGVPLSAISKRSSLEKAMRRMYGDLRAELHAEASALEAHVM